jgi:hypothetical protein
VVWWVVPRSVMRCLWQKWNAYHFDYGERAIPALKLLFLQTMYEWVVGLGIFSIHSLVELIDICTL